MPPKVIALAVVLVVVKVSALSAVAPKLLESVMAPLPAFNESDWEPGAGPLIDPLNAIAPLPELVLIVVVAERTTGVPVVA